MTRIGKLDCFILKGEMEDLISRILTELGEDPEREGLRGTPARMARSLKYLTSGYQEDAREVLNEALFTVAYDEMVIVRDIEVFSLCEHHLLPFFGKCHVGYIPRDQVIGLSKIPRIVDIFARRLQVQERLTQQVAETIRDAINPLGVAVAIEAQHLCMMMRGVQKRNSKMITSAMLGRFRKDQRSRGEFLDLIQASGT